jgi:hypothetical protein
MTTLLCESQNESLSYFGQTVGVKTTLASFLSKQNLNSGQIIMQRMVSSSLLVSV